MRLYELTSSIRDLINEPWKHHSLFKDKGVWNQLCSSLDAIGDTDLAISAFSKNEYPADEGEKYLRIYGILQSLFVQQDVVKHLAESLGEPTDLLSHPKIKRIRKIRNWSVGHPTRVDHSKPLSAHHVSRSTICKEGFLLLSFFENGKYKFKNVYFPTLIADQEQCLSTVLRKLVSKLKKEQREYKRKFRGIKLQDVFPANLNYMLSKVWESVHKRDANLAVLAVLDVRKIESVLNDLRTKLQERGLDVSVYSGMKSIYEELEYPLKQLSIQLEKLKKGSFTRLSRQTATIFVDFVKYRMAELETMACEIDKEYSN